jgi:hypothetical protein
LTRRGDEECEPAEGGHAAERLREFIRERFPGGLPNEESPLDEPPERLGEPREGVNEEGDEDLSDENS